MDEANVLGAVLYCLITCGCAAVLYGIGRWACTSDRPMGFWTGKEVKPETVTDIPAYNLANGKMWKRYSLPYWLSGLLGLGGFIHDGFTYAAVSVLMLACVPGFFFLVRHYRKIEKQYILR